ncbi:MAG: hypothetical protein V4488_26215 [Pseudomonadota bacterium]
MTNFAVNGNHYSDDGSSDNDMNNGGFRDHLLPMLSDVVTDTSAKVVVATTQVGLATAQANIATAAAAAAVASPGTSATSVTPLTLGLGIQNLFIQPNKTIPVGAWYVVANTPTPQIQMAGSVKSYDSATGALQLSVTVVKGAGTFSAWTVSLSAPIPSLASYVTSVNTGYNITAADQNNLLKYTGAAPGTLTADSVVALGNGFSGWIKATRSSLTFDPNGADQVNGALTCRRYSGKPAMRLSPVEIRMYLPA